MARTISRGLSLLLEELELERPQLVTISQLAELCEKTNVRTPAKVVASRLREKGWLLATSQRGVWEFAPAELAGPYSSADPLLSIKARTTTHPNERLALASQTAAWALGLADRVPAVLDVAFEQAPSSIPNGVHASTYRPNIPIKKAKGIAVLAPESIVVHMAQRPSALRSWQGVAEWLPDVAYELSAATMLNELENRPQSVAVRTGYLLQGMRPDIAKTIMKAYPPRSKVRFGTGTAARATTRNDERWQISDSTLSFDPREMERVL